MPFQVALSPWLSTEMNLDWLKANVKWTDFGNGSRLGKLAREGSTGLVLYHVADGAPDDAFAPHTHTGGEMYFVLQGEVYDEEGTYPAGTMVWMEPGSRHTPKTRGETYILTLWPGGVKA